MTLSIRRLGPGDDVVLARLGEDDADFDIAGRGGPLEPLSLEAAQQYLADPAVLHWIAIDDGLIVGHMYCHQLRKRGGDPIEVLLYEIGVRNGHRRKGIGRALVGALTDWMTSNDVTEVWVVADNPGAVEFYRACGFASDERAPTYMTRSA